MANIRTLNSKNSSAQDIRLLLSIAFNSTVSLAPSKCELPDGTVKFSRLSLNTISRFPRDLSENFVNQETLIDFQSGLIYGGYQLSNNFSNYIPSAGKSVCVAIQIDENDRLRFSYGAEGTLEECVTAAKKMDSSLVSYDSEHALIWICVLTSDDGTNLKSLTESDIFDLRVFTNLSAPSTKNLQNKHISGSVGPRLMLIKDVSASQTALTVAGNLKFSRNEKLIVKSTNPNYSTAIEQSLIDLSGGSYSVRPVAEASNSKALRKSNGTDWSLGVDYSYGDNLKNVPAVGNKLYGSVDGITLYNDADGVSGGIGGRELSLLIPDLRFIARNLSSYASYIPLNREVAIDPEAGILKFGSDFNFGDGRHGNLSLSAAGIYSLNQPINGVTYCRSRKVSNHMTKSSRVINYGGTDLALTEGDVVLIYTAQVAESISRVGNYSVLKVKSASTGTITVQENISHNQTGVAFEFDGVSDNVFVLTIPQFNNVTIGTGVTLTCDEFSSTDGFGVLAFMASGTVQTTGSGKISADGKGYRGATVHGGSGQGYLINSLNALRQTAKDSGGAGGSFGADGVGGLAGTEASSSSFEALGGHGGGSGGNGGGSGGGGGYASVGTSGGFGGVAGAGGGGGGATSIGTSLPSGTSTDGGTGDGGFNGVSGSLGGVGGIGITAGYEASGGNGGGLASSQSNGGSGGLSAGSADIVSPLFGGGGGSAGRGGNGGSGKLAGGVSNSSAGASGGGATEGSGSSGISTGGHGGGLILILADQLNGASISSSGTAGTAGANALIGGSSSQGYVSGSSNPPSGSGVGGDGAGGSSGAGGGGGGGAGGTILVFARLVSNSYTIAALGGNGGTGGSASSGASSSSGAINSFASAGGGGAGGSGTLAASGGNGANGRVRLNYFYYTGFFPANGSGAASWSASTPNGFLGKIARVDENRYLRGSFNFYDETTYIDSVAEVVEVESYVNEMLGTDIASTKINIKSPLKFSHRCLNAAAIYRNKQSLSVDAILEKYNSRILFDSGLLSMSSGMTLANMKHGVNLSLNSFTPMVFVYNSNTFTTYENSGSLVSTSFVNDNEVVGVFVNVQEDTFTITTGASGLYYFLVGNSYISNGYVRVLFVRN
jgi:hypothetical protein